MGIPHHRNIGDNAIAVAEDNIINTYFSEYEKYELPESNLEKCARRIKNMVKEDDIILLHGGGNIGDTYEKPERGRRAVIESFPNNKIIIFPQTAFFSDTEKGKKELEESKKIYNEHNHLVILAREKKSFNFMRENFTNATIYLTPDIVMTLKETLEDTKRKGALLLFRTDQEKTLENDVIKKIKEISTREYGKYILSDMSYGNVRLINVAGEFRNKILNEKFAQYQTSEIAITDRLHGMIFAAITETPCIVFSNFNHKISESYDWLRNLNYIKFCDDAGKIEKYIKELKNIKKCKYDNQFALDIIVPILKKEIES